MIVEEAIKDRMIKLRRLIFLKVVSNLYLFAHVYSFLSYSTAVFCHQRDLENNSEG
jgi:hypothetical protein